MIPPPDRHDPNAVPGNEGGDGSSPAPAVDAQILDGPIGYEAGGCPSGKHSCSGACVDDLSPLSCGVSCEPCPTVKGGTAACDGTRRGITCPGTQSVCKDSCVDKGSPCDGACPDGQNPCTGLCVDGRSLNFCGPSCTPCPTSANGKASCDGQTCDLQCDAGFHKCGSNCVSDNDPQNCGSSCTKCSSNHRTPTCANQVCAGACAGGFADCDGDPANGCETDLSKNGNCGACNTTCASGSSCTGKRCVVDCVPKNCSANCGQTGRQECVNEVLQPCSVKNLECCAGLECSKCRTCNANGKCEGGCPSNQTCNTSNACVPNCDPECCGKSGTSCSNGVELTCINGRKTQTKPCASGTCGANGSCEPCGLEGQACCPQGGCTQIAHICSPRTHLCEACGGEDQWCCNGQTGCNPGLTCTNRGPKGGFGCSPP
jgi:hypothetical protein